MYKQLIYPDISIETNAGWCLWETQEIYHVPHLYHSAWEAWEATKLKHYDRTMPNASVPCYFEHWGTYGTPPTYGNWGHIVAYVPDVGFVSSPMNGEGQDIFQTLEEIEQNYNCTFVGWSEDLSGELIVTGGQEMNVQEIQEAIGLLMLATQVGEKPGGYASDGQVQYYTNAITNNPSGGFKELAKDLLNAQANVSMRWKAFDNTGGYPYLTKRVAELEAQPKGEFIEAPKMYIKK